MRPVPEAPPGPAPASASAARPDRVVALGRALFRVRGWVYVPFAAAALLLRWGEVDAPLATWPAGLALMATGVALRFSCIRRMGGAARTHKHKAKRLVDSGPYAWVRNPLYVANTTAFLGFIVLCGLPWFALASWLLLWAYYHAIARYEETVLAETFGEEFQEYRRRTPLWIPRPPKDPPAEDPAEFYPLGKILRRERGALLNVGVMIALAAAKGLLGR
jgi:protein-S-isoprenylcysteine O-methyltransferase Ste14